MLQEEIHFKCIIPIQKLGKRPQENTEGFEKLKEKMAA